MELKIIYVLVASESNLYLEELWASLYSLRQFHPDVAVTVLVDRDTASMINARKELKEMITTVTVVPTPEHYNAKQRSRQMRTKKQPFSSSHLRV